MEEDRISNLPDCVLGSIVSFLPPKAAARTMVLARRWRHIWPSLPLDLNLDSPNSDVRFLSAGTILSILSSHRGPIRRFSVTTRAGMYTCAWLQALAQRNIVDTLALKWATDLEHPSLPRSLLGSAGVTLRFLDLHCCRLGLSEDPRPPVPPLPHLDFLRLSNVLISETALHGMIQCCSVLRELHLIMMDGLCHLKLCSSTLTTICISTPLAPLVEFSDRGIPNLRSVTFSYINLWRIPVFKIDSAKKLKEVGLQLPTLDSPRLSLVTNKIPLPFVTYLVFGMKFHDDDELQKVIHLLSLFPCLRRLEIWCFNFGSKNWDGFSQGPPGETVSCLSEHLSHVLLKGYCGTVGEVEFARYLMARSKLLMSMEMNHSIDWSEDDINRQKESICMGGQASPLAQIYFTKNTDLDRVRGKLASYLDIVPMI